MLVSELPTISTTYTVTNLNDAHCTSIATDLTGSATITVNIPSVITSALLHASSATLCNNGSQETTLTQTGGTLGTLAYWQWYTNPTFTNPIGGAISASSASLTVSPTVTTTYYLRAEGNASPCAAIYPISSSITVTVNQPSIGGTIANATPCSTSGTLILESYFGTIQKWQYSSSQNFSANVTNLNNTTVQQAYNISTITYYRAVVANGICAAVYSNPITINDTTRPTWVTAPGGLNTTIGCADPNGLAAAEAMIPLVNDDFNQALTLVKTNGNFLSAGGVCQQTGTYINTWTVSDVCHYTSRTIFSQIISVIDNTIPSWTTIAGALDQTISCNNSSGLALAQLLTPVASDACSGTTTPIKIAGNFIPNSNTCSQSGTYTNTWTVTDLCNGAISAPFTQTITVIDQTPPVWTNAPAHWTGPLVVMMLMDWLWHKHWFQRLLIIAQLP